MKNRINVAELLKDCPKGMKLDCTMYNSVTLINVDNSGNTIFPIKVKLKNGDIVNLTKYGQYTTADFAKCVIYPKGKTTWEGFVPPGKFKNGDIIFTHANCLNIGLGNTWISIFQEYRNGGVAAYVDYAEVGQDYYGNADGDKGLLCMEKDILRQRLATEEEKQRLFKAIKENGYRWNPETKTLEKLIQSKFKVGDKVRHKNNHNVVVTITNIEEDYYACGTNKAFWFTEQDDYELVPNKFDITTLKPFDKVLVRLTKDSIWHATFFSHYDKEIKWGCYPFVTTSSKSYPMCIPYKGNEHLTGKKDNCDEYYRIW